LVASGEEDPAASAHPEELDPVGDLAEPAFAAFSASERFAEPSLPGEASGVSALVPELGEAFLWEVPSSEASLHPSEEDPQAIPSAHGASLGEQVDPSEHQERRRFPLVCP